jgi:hypothetical protein
MKQTEWQVLGIVASIFIISLLPTVFISCSNQQRNPVEPSKWNPTTDLSTTAKGGDVECKIKKPLWVGAVGNDMSIATRVGMLVVTNTATSLKMKYNLKPGYTLNDEHIYVGISPPTTAAPDQFPYNSVPLSIPLAAFDDSEEGLLYMATYARVCRDDDDDDDDDGEDGDDNDGDDDDGEDGEDDDDEDDDDCARAWAGGTDESDYAFIDQDNPDVWGWYFPYTISCDERARLSQTAADLRAIGTAIGSFMVDNGYLPGENLFDDLAGYYEGAAKDGWGTDYVYEQKTGSVATCGEYQTEAECLQLPEDNCFWETDPYEWCAWNGVYTLSSWGKDGSQGGGGGEFDSDIYYVNGQFVAPSSLVD